MSDIPVAVAIVHMIRQLFALWLALQAGEITEEQAKAKMASITSKINARFARKGKTRP